MTQGVCAAELKGLNGTMEAVMCELMGPVRITAAVPRAALEGLPRRATLIDVSEEGAGDDRMIKVVVLGGIGSPVTTLHKPVGMSYPEWRPLIPFSTNGEAAQFAPTTLGAIFAAFAALYGRNVVPFIRHNGFGNALVSYGDGAKRPQLMCVMMPVQTGPLHHPVSALAGRTSW